MPLSFPSPRFGALPAVLVSAALLAGCASMHGLKPEGRALDSSTVHSERSLGGVQVDAASWPKTDWWKAFGDPQLDALVDEVLAGNPDLAIADARAREAVAQAGVVDAARKPSLSATASIAGAKIPTTLIPAPFGGHFGVAKYGILDFKWDFDLWGGRRAAWEAALGNARAAEVESQAARLMLSAEVVGAYAALGDAYTQRDLAQADLERAQTFDRLTMQRVKAGIDSKFQQTQADAAVAQARAQVAAADNEVRSSGIGLAVLLGRGPDRALDIKPPKPLPANAIVLPSTLPADLIGRRPDVVAARWHVEASAKDIKSAKAAFLPDVNIMALAGLIAGPGKNLFQAAAGLYSVAPAVSLPIFEGGKLRANLAGKDAAYDLAVAQYNKTVIAAVNQVAQQVDVLQALDAQIAQYEQAQASASQAYDLAMQRYRGGVGNYLEALTVRENLIGAERKLAALQTRRAGAAVQLIEALGGGFTPSSDTPSVSAAAAQVNNDHKAKKQ
ncbi:MAG TPA: efflux transporter outer membrane subunit [Rhodanobacteraceae bacterium]|nr:efflux transporter outer membrane subunit [Rhodanobacteraceae bacterium]